MINCGTWFCVQKTEKKLKQIEYRALPHFQWSDNKYEQRRETYHTHKQKMTNTPSEKLK